MLGQWVIQSIDPENQRIILKIVGFLITVDPIKAFKKIIRQDVHSFI